MQIGKITGNVWATRKEEKLTGLKFLIVQPIFTSRLPTESSFIAVDQIGAGVGDTVMVTKGSAASHLNTKSSEKLPIDALVIGIVDSMEVNHRGDANE